MSKTIEYKDARGKHRIKHTADNGRVIYSSTQGYKNKDDMRQAAIIAAIQLLRHYSRDISVSQHIEIMEI